MKKIIPRILLMVMTFTMFDSCQTTKDKEESAEKPKESKVDYRFSGRIASTKGEIISGATITINGKEVRSDAKGSFDAKPDSAGRYIVTIKKRGFGTVSKIFTSPVRDYTYQLQPAFIKVIDPTKPNTVTDLLSAECVGCGFQNLSFDAAYKRIPLVYDGKGNLVNFGWTPQLKTIFDLLTGPPICNPGATVMIPAGSVVDDTGNEITTPVTISITTIDLRSPDGMPGDYTFENENERGAMQSRGAVSIELYDEKTDRSFNLKQEPKLPVRLSVPVDPLAIRAKSVIPETIPVLYYQEKTGMWRQEKKQMAKLNKKTKAYEFDVKHFSSINLDFFTAPTCIRFRQVPTSATAGTPGARQSPFRIHAWTEPGPGFTTHYGAENGAAGCFEDANGTNLHLLYNAPPPGTNVAIVLTNNTSPPTAAYGVAIVPTGLTYTNGTGTVATDLVHTCTSPTCSTAACAFSSTCVDLNMTLFPDNAILAAARNTTTGMLELRWILQNPPPSTDGVNYKYEVMYRDTSAPGSTLTPYPGGPFTEMYNPASPIDFKSIPLTTFATFGGLEIKVVIKNELGGSDQPSNTLTP